jgi:glycosidase
MRRVACLVLMMSGCGSGMDTDVPFRPFDPGNGNGGNYGSGSGGGGTVDPPVCPDEYRACAVELTFPDHGETSVELRGDFAPGAWTAGVAMLKSAGQWRASVNVLFNKTITFKFFVNGTTWVHDTTQPTMTDMSGNVNNVKTAGTCDPFLCEEPVVPPDVFDWRDAIIYFPMVDRFFDGDGQNPCRVTDARVADLANFKGGDWAGITQKINAGYFDAMGVNTIWLSVPFENAIGPDEGVNQNAGKWFTGYHAYWPKDLDPKTPYHCFGTANDLKTLVTTAHGKGMKVIVDYAMVHVHVTAAIYAQHKDWFWTIAGNPYTTCNGSLWDVFSESNGNVYWDENREGNKCWFTPMLAHWNYANVDARKYAVDMAIAWIKEYEFDGLRLDAIKHVHMDWLKDLRARVKTDILPSKKMGERFYLLGETYDGDPRKLKVHVDPNTMLDGQFDFALKPAVVDAMLTRNAPMTTLEGAVKTSETYYGTNVVMSTFVGNHDQARSIAAAGGENAAGYERLANAFAVLMTVKGAPSILYGDEIGMPGGEDPDNRRVMVFSGLSADRTKLKDRIGKLAKIRLDHPALRRGSRTNVTLDNDLWFFKVSTTGDELWVAINRGDTDRTINGLPSGNLTELVTTTSVSGPNATIPARQTRIFKQ